MDKVHQLPRSGIEPYCRNREADVLKFTFVSGVRKNSRFLYPTDDPIPRDHLSFTSRNFLSLVRSVESMMIFIREYIEERGCLYIQLYTNNHRFVLVKENEKIYVIDSYLNLRRLQIREFDEKALVRLILNPIVETWNEMC
jgi:hypothetical protein